MRSSYYDELGMPRRKEESDLAHRRDDRRGAKRCNVREYRLSSWQQEGLRRKERELNRKLHRYDSISLLFPFPTCPPGGKSGRNGDLKHSENKQRMLLLSSSAVVLAALLLL